MGVWNKVGKIHFDIKKVFEYVPDPEKWKQPDYWATLDESKAFDETIRGDCDDFAIACRQKCKEARFKSRLVYCKTEKGGHHLVCEVEGWILDNRYSEIKAQEDLDYEWISISGYEKSDKWHCIK